MNDTTQNTEKLSPFETPHLFVRNLIQGGTLPAHGKRTCEEVARPLGAILANWQAEPDAQKKADRALPMMRLLQEIGVHTKYLNGNRGAFIRSHRFAIPTEAASVAALNDLRSHAVDVLKRGPQAYAQEGSRFRLMAEGLNRPTYGDASALLCGGIKDETQVASGSGDSARFGLGFVVSPEIMRDMPKGKRIVSPWTGQGTADDLDGFEIDGDDAQEMRKALDMCEDGTAEWLSQHGIDHETEGGSYDCGSCGSEHEGDGVEVTWIGDFTFTREMIRTLPDEDACAEWLAENVEEFPGGWEHMIGDIKDDAEAVLARFSPPSEVPEDAGRFDPARWNVVPDLALLDGIDDLETEDAIKVLSILGRAAERWISAGLLPPFACTFTHVPLGKPWKEENRNGSFRWSPYSWEMRHDLTRDAGGNGVRFFYAAGNTDCRIESHAAMGQSVWVGVENLGHRVVAWFGPTEAGEDAGLCLSLCSDRMTL